MMRRRHDAEEKFYVKNIFGFVSRGTTFYTGPLSIVVVVFSFGCGDRLCPPRVQLPFQRVQLPFQRVQLPFQRMLLKATGSFTSGCSLK